MNENNTNSRANARISGKGWVNIFNKDNENKRGSFQKFLIDLN